MLVQNLIAFAFLPIVEISSAFTKAKNKLEQESGTEELIWWFEDNYIIVHKTKILQNSNIFQSSTIFSLELWSVFGQIKPRTQINVEGWHRRWKYLVGVSHVGIFWLFWELQKDQKNIEITRVALLCREKKKKQKMSSGKKELKMLF